MLALLFAGCDSGASPDAIKARELKSDAARLSLVRFSDDGAYLAAGSAEGEVFVWSDLSVAPAKMESGLQSPLVSLTWATGQLLFLTDLDHGFVGWQLGKTQPTPIELPSLSAPAVCIAIRPKSNPIEVVLGTRDGSLLFLGQNDTKSLKSEHRGAVKQIVFTPDGRSLITAGVDGKLIWRDSRSRKIVEVVKAHDTDISRLILSSDGKQLISGDWNGQLTVWDVSTRKSLRSFEQPDAVSGLGWVHGQLITASWDGVLRLWNAASGQPLRTIPTGQPIHDLAVDPRTERVATVSLDRSVRLWELPK